MWEFKTKWIREGFSKVLVLVEIGASENELGFEKFYFQQTRDRE